MPQSLAKKQAMLTRTAGEARSAAVTVRRERMESALPPEEERLPGWWALRLARMKSASSLEMQRCAAGSSVIRKYQAAHLRPVSHFNLKYFHS